MTEHSPHSCAQDIPRKEGNGPYFNYEEAFSRNIGWVSDAEQQILRTKRIAIAGMGGVGGVHLLTLVRMGFCKFHISDMDDFELANFNRQIGAMSSTVGKSKVETLEKMARDINPEIEIKSFKSGIKDENLEAFLTDVDLFVDGFDFFVLEIRAMCFQRCRELGIPCVTAGPMGMGAGYLIFVPDGMSFLDYFGFDHLSGQDRVVKYVNFLVGLSPYMIQRPYIADESRIDLTGQRGPSTGMACQLCAGVAGIQAVKLLLGRGEILPAPYFHHFDPYLNRYVIRKIWWGHRNPWQTIKRLAGYRLFGKMSKNAKPKEIGPDEFKRPIERILNMARWAPSGDNSQPWRFKIISDDCFEIHAQLDTGLSVYNYGDGEPTWLALGMLQETADLAAGEEGYSLSWEQNISENSAVFTAKMLPSDMAMQDMLSRQIPIRSVDRRPYKQTKLTNIQKKLLAEELGDELGIIWHESASVKRRAGLMNALGTRIRLLIGETHPVHERVIDFGHKFSKTGMPSSALGLDPIVAALMRWLMQSQNRMQVMLRWMGGIYLAQLEMDIMPARGCAAHFSIYWKNDPPEDLTICHRQDTLLQAGRRIQRFWLKATEMQMKMQPNLAPLCFSDHARRGVAFTENKTAMKQASIVSNRVDEMFEGNTPLFFGRIGHSKSASGGARSIRQDLEDLMID